MLFMPSVTVSGIACPLLETHYAFVGATEPDAVFPRLVVAGKYRNSDDKRPHRAPVVLTMGDRAFDKRSFAPVLRLLSPLPEAGKPIPKSVEFHYLGTEAYPSLEGAGMMIDRMSPYDSVHNTGSWYNVVSADSRVASLRHITDRDELDFYFASALYAFDPSKVHPDYSPTEDQLTALEMASRLLANKAYSELALLLQEPVLNAPLAAAAIYLNLAMSMMGSHHEAEAEMALTKAESIYTRQESIQGLDLVALVRARWEKMTQLETSQDVFFETTDVEDSPAVVG